MRGAAMRAMLARAHTFTTEGLHVQRVTVEVDIRAGLPAFVIVGLADAAVREARERVQAAIRNWLRVPVAPDHREPCAGGCAQGRTGARPRARVRRAGGKRPGSARPPRQLRAVR